MVSGTRQNTLRFLVGPGRPEAFDFASFNAATYTRAVSARRMQSENAPKVLYPNDEMEQGKTAAA